MKKNKIYNIICAVVCFLLWFIPVGTGIGLVATMTCFAAAVKANWAFTAECISYTLLIILGILAIILLIVRIIKENFITKCFSSIGCSLYIIMWLVALFAKFSAFDSIYESLASGSDALWLVLYFVLFIAIIVLQLLQWLPHIHINRRPTKTERMQAQIDELQKQVDELKKGD